MKKLVVLLLLLTVSGCGGYGLKDPAAVGAAQPLPITFARDEEFKNRTNVFSCGDEVFYCVNADEDTAPVVGVTSLMVFVYELRDTHDELINTWTQTVSPSWNWFFLQILTGDSPPGKYRVELIRGESEVYASGEYTLR